MFKRLISVVLAMAMLTVVFQGQALAGTTGTANGTYDFGSLGPIDSAGPGFARLGDKFRVGNSQFAAWRNVNTGPYTVIYPDVTTASAYTAVIKAEGGATCKTFTFKDLGVSATTAAQKFETLDIVLKDVNGIQIGSTISLSGSSLVFPDTSVTNVSTLFNPQGPWNVPNVASVEITFTLSDNGSPANAWFLNLENITIANVAAPVAAPVVSGVSPSNGPTTGGTSVVITGVDFTGVTAVAFGGIPATGYIVNSPTQITATSPAGSPGIADITVTSTSGMSVTGGSDQFSYTIIPTIVTISPSVSSTAGGGTVTINGFNFTGATSVNFGGTIVTPATVSPTQITAISPPGPSGELHVTVTTPSGTSTTTAADLFSYTALPTISGISPPFGSTGGGTTVTITGTNFLAATSVKFGSIAATSFVIDSDTNITATSPLFSSPAQVDIKVSTSIDFAVSPVPFTFNNATGTAAGTYDFGSLDINDSAGAGFARLGDKFKVGNDQFFAWVGSLNTGVNTTVYPNWNFTSSHTAVIKAEGGLICKMFTFKDLGISAVFPLQKFDSLAIVLKDKNGTTIYSKVLGSSPDFISTGVTNLSSLYPADGPWTIKGTDGSIKGVDGVAAIEITYTMSEGVNATDASNLTLENITIANVEIAAPVVTNISLSSGPTVGGTSVIVNGDHFIGTTAVKFGASDAAGYTVVSPTQITAVSPARAAAGSGDITVTTSLGISVASPFTYNKTNQAITFGPAPTINIPNSGILVVTATSGLIPAVSSATTSVCTVSGSTITSVTAGVCTIVADQAGDAKYNPAPQATLSFSVGRTPQSIIFALPPTVVVGGNGTAAATADSGLQPTFSSTTATVCTVSGATVTGLTVGNCIIAADQIGNSSYNPAPQVLQTIIVGKGNQSITFGTPPTVVFGSTGTVVATASSGLSAVFSSTTTAVCIVRGTTVTGVTAGSCTIAADQGGNVNYYPAPQATLTFTVGKAAQSTTFDPAPTVVVGGTGTVGASTGSGLTPIFSSTTPVVCTTSGTTVTGVTSGRCIITANQGGDANYNATPQVTLSFTIGKGSQSITFSPAPTVVVDGTGTVVASVLSSLVPTFSSTTPAVCTVSGATVTGVTVGTCTIAANQIGNDNYNAAPSVTLTFTIGKGSQVITFDVAPNLSFGGTTGTVNATGGASPLPVTYSSLFSGICTVSGATVTPVSAGTCAIAANQAGNANYTAAVQVVQNITVAKATPIITWLNPAAIMYGTALSATQLNAASGGVAGSFSYTPASGTLLSAGAGQTLSVTFTPTDTANYSSSVKTAAITVTAAAQTLSFGTPPTIAFGGTGTVVATATSGLTPTFNSATPDVCTVSGTTVTGVLPGSCTITADQSGSNNYSAASQVSQTFTIDKGYQSIVFNPMPDVMYGNSDFSAGATATSGKGITYESSNQAVAEIVNNNIHIVGIGSATIFATQSGDGNYYSAFASRTLTVKPAVLTVTSDNKSRAFGAANPAFTATISGFVNNENAAVVSGAPNFITTADSSSPVGSYTVTPVLGSLLSANYTYTFVAGTLAVGLTSQNITFKAIPATTYGAAPIDLKTLVTGGGSSIPITFTVESGPGNLTGTVLSITGAGDIIITASQAGNGSYASATARQTLTVKPAPLSVTADNLSWAVGTPAPAFTHSFTGFVNNENAAVVSGAPSFTSSATAGSAVGSYLIILSPGTLSAANYTFTLVDGTLAVGLVSQKITFDALPAATYGGPPITMNAISDLGLSVSYSSSNAAVATVNGNLLTIVGVGNAVITASQVGDVSSASAFAQQNIVVGKATPVISWSNPGDILFGTALNSTQLNATTGGLAGNLVYVPTFGTVPQAGSGQSLSVSFIPADTVNYTSSAVASVAINVVTSSQIITFGAAPKVVAGGSGIVVATATSGLSPSFTSTTPGVCTINGTTVTGITAGSCTIAADQSGNSNINAAPQVLQSFTVNDVITLSTLADGAVSSVAIVNIAGTAITPNGLQKLTINTVPVSVTTVGSFSTPVTLVPGKNTITVVATDNNNLASTVVRTITLDATAPLITLTSGQTDNSVTSTSHTTISGTVDSASTTVKISTNGGALEPAVMSGTGFYLPVILSNGLNTIVITATDTSGKSSSIKQTVILNTALSLAITAPAHDLKSGKANFVLAGTVNGAAPLTVTVVMDGQSFSPAVANGGFTQALTFAAEKSYPIVVTAHDGSGNTVSVTRTVNYAWLGDSDGSGITDLSDVLSAYQISKGLKNPSATDLRRCDVAPLDANGKPEGNGVIDIGDVILMLRNRIGLVNW